MWLIAIALIAASQVSTQEHDAEAYHRVLHYRIEIPADVEVVWPHVMDLGAWMFDFDLELVAGEPGTVGEVRRLYAGQDHLLQVVGLITNQLLVLANLPATMAGEESTGVAVLTLNEGGGATVVDLTMSWRHEWRGTGENPLRARRESAEFVEATDAMWSRFHERLRALALDG
ncbi:MAG: hypothetical protein AAGE01_18475 [Pseudomonadota bacterium]